MTNEANRGSWNVDDLLAQLRDFFSAQRINAFVVGGLVRDRLLGRATADVDLVVAGPAIALARELAAQWRGVPVELDSGRATARVVLVRHAGRPEVDLKSFAGTLEEDLLDRDFTVNAMAVPLDRATEPGWERELIDPSGGRSDLRRRTLRWVTPKAPRRDPLRLLRAVRLSATLGFALDSKTASTIRALAPTLARCAPERICTELFGALGGSDAPERLAECHGLGLLEAIWGLVPEHERRGVEPVWVRGVDVARRAHHLLLPGSAWLPAPVWEALGKWQCEVVAGDRTSRQFLLWLCLATTALGHGSAAALNESLQLSRRELAVGRQAEQSAPLLARLLRTPNVRGSEWLSFFRGAGGAAPFCLLAAAAEEEGVRLRVSWLLGQYLRPTPIAMPDPLVSGAEIRRRLPATKGERVGNLLRTLENAHADGLIGTRRQAMAFLMHVAAAREGAHCGD